jgi:integrase
MRGSIRRRGESWTVTYDEPAGATRKQRSKGGFATKREAQAFLTEALRRIDVGTYSAPARVTLGAYLADEWLPAATPTLRPSSVATYGHMVKHLEPLGGVKLQALRPAHLNALYGDLEAAGLSPTTIRLVHSVAHRALADAMKWGLVARNAAAAADPPRPARPRATAWTATELGRFLDHVADDRVYALWRLAGTTGMRRGELLGLTWRALDLEGGRLTVEQQLTTAGGGGVAFGPPKSERSRRTIALDPDTVQALQVHRDAQVLERDFAGDAYADQDLVFADELGAPIHPDRLSRDFMRLRLDARIETGSLHTLRHTAATLMLTNGIPVHVAAARLGDRPEQILKTYAHLLPQSDELAAERVAAVIGDR